LLALVVTGMGGAEEEFGSDRVQVSVGSVPHSVSDVTPLEGSPGIHIVRFFLGTTVAPAESVEIHLRVDDRVSVPVPIAVAPGS